MSISEVVQLVIQIGAMAKGEDVILLYMGESVKIVDLAKKMISLAGYQLKNKYNPNGDIKLITLDCVLVKNSMKNCWLEIMSKVLNIHVLCRLMNN